MHSNILQLDEFIAHNLHVLTLWIEEYRNGRPWPLYSSIDIRNAGYKIAHVDSNAFPAGFNNLPAASLIQGGQLFAEYINTHYNGKQKILLIPENITRNLGYIHNIEVLKEMLTKVGFEVLLGSPYILSDGTYGTHKIYKILRIEEKITLSNYWEPDIILLNDDLTSGLPIILDGVNQPIIPASQYGWYLRRKSNHFTCYGNVLSHLKKDFDIDPWLISIYFNKCYGIAFKAKTGLECLAQAADDVILQTSEKYNEYGIKEAPYVFLKADNGTFGMGILELKNGHDIFNINKKSRHSLNVIKYGVANTEIMIQEGIPTKQQFNNHPAESVVYSVNGEIIGEILRYNEMENSYSNLNSRGMKFTTSHHSYDLNISTNKLKWLIVKLANLAMLDEFYSDCIRH